MAKIGAVYEHPDEMTAEVERAGRTVVLTLECDTLDMAEVMENYLRRSIAGGSLNLAIPRQERPK